MEIVVLTQLILRDYQIKNVSVRNHPGSNTEDLKSYIIPTIKNGKDIIVIHSGCNDLPCGIDTIQNLQSIINQVRKKSVHTKIAISSILIRKDKKDMEIKVKDLNAK